MTTDQPARRMLQVKRDKYIYLPGRLLTHQRGKDRIWLRPGAVIDATDPFVTHCLLGQEYKLLPAPEGATQNVDPTDHVLIRAYRRELARQAEPRKPDPKREAAKAAAAEVGLSAGIPVPDEPPAPREPGPFDALPAAQGELIPGAEDKDPDPQPVTRRGKKS